MTINEYNEFFNVVKEMSHTITPEDNINLCNQIGESDKFFFEEKEEHVCIFCTKLIENGSSSDHYIFLPNDIIYNKNQDLIHLLSFPTKFYKNTHNIMTRNIDHEIASISSRILDKRVKKEIIDEDELSLLQYYVYLKTFFEMIYNKIKAKINERSILLERIKNIIKSKTVIAPKPDFLMEDKIEYNGKYYTTMLDNKGDKYFIVKGKKKYIHR